MQAPTPIDVSLDLRLDSRGRDPDQHRATLRSYHQILWSKPLPDGTPFYLEAVGRSRYLHHRSSLGKFFFASDSIIRTFDWHPRAQEIIPQIPASDRDEHLAESYTIGGIFFPGNRIDNKQTINQSRGTHPRISDRFDLTLECIRRHYERQIDDQINPLGKTLLRYSDLFADFPGYVDFFLLQDLVDHDYNTVRFFSPFADFTTPAIPQSLGEYLAYRELLFSFLRARNERISDFSERLVPLA